MMRKLAGRTVLMALVALAALLSVVNIASRVLAKPLERSGGGGAPALDLAARGRLDVAALYLGVRIRRFKEALARGMALPAAFRWSAMPAIAGGAAATADRLTPMKPAMEKEYPVAASTTIYAGTMVAVDTNGYLKPAADAANLKVVGNADVKSDNSAGANGDKKVKVRRGVFRLPASSITQAMVGKVMYVVDDQTFDDAKGTNGIKAGRLVEFISATEGWLEILGPMGLGAVTANAGATYTATEQALINELKTIVNDYLA